MFGLWQALAELLQALQVEIQRFARVCKSFGKSRAARDDLCEIREVDYICGLMRTVINFENKTAVLMMRCAHSFRTSSNFWISVGLQVFRPPWGTTTVISRPSAW